MIRPKHREDIANPGQSWIKKNLSMGRFKRNLVNNTFIGACNAQISFFETEAKKFCSNWKVTKLQYELLSVSVQQKGMSIFGAGVFCHSSPVTLQQSIRFKWITQQIIVVAYVGDVLF